MSSAVQRDETSNTYQSIGTDGSTALKQLAAERLAAHRNRRAAVEGHEAQERRAQAEADINRHCETRAAVWSRLTAPKLATGSTSDARLGS